MRQLRLTLLLLRPSLISSSTCLVAAACLLTITNRAFLAYNPTLNTYLFGANGLFNALQSSPFSLSGAYHSVFTHSLSRNILTYLFILFITIVIFGALEGSSKAFNQLSAGANELRTAAAPRFALLRREIWARAVTRMLVVTVWAVYAIIFASVVLPFCVQQARFGIATIGQLSHVQYIAVGSGVLLVALHLHVVFARMLVLRPRIFGGIEELLATEKH